MMRWSLALFFSFFLSATAHAAPVEGEWVATEHTRARLIAPEVVAGGAEFPLLIEVELQPEWHTYWLNPGDSGIPTRVNASLPDGWKAADLQYTIPHRFESEGLVSYGYSNQAKFILPVTPDAALDDSAEETLTAELKMLVCKDVCIPENATLSIRIAAGNTADAKEATAAERFSDVQRTIPKIYAENDGRFVEEDGQIRFDIPPSLFNDLMERHAERDLFVLTQGVTGIDLPKAYETDDEEYIPPSLPKGTMDVGSTIDAVLYSALGEHIAAWQVRFYRDDAAAATAAPTSTVAAGGGSGSAEATTPAADDGNALSYLAILLSAVLGGLILNAMPCVFPVLSLKALALARKAESESAVVRAHGLAYTGGVLVCFAALGALMLVLQSAGQQIGWGFQLQSPGFVAAMVSLFFLLGLNLLGLFEFPLLGANLQASGKESSKGSFLTGLLAALVATPCTAPFMGSALGAAIGRPAFHAMGVFIALGIGMALPFLLLSLRPSLARCLPKPGVWMARLKEILAFPMLAAALWLLWVLAQQVGPIGLAWALTALLLIALSVWGWRIVQFKTTPVRWGFVLLAALLWIGCVRAIVADPVVPVSATGQIAHVLPNAENYNAERLTQLRAEGRAVFIDATAAWCLTCKVNERGALASDSVKELFAQRNIAVLVADWTNEDPAITALLKSFGRNGVPIYAFYPADGSAPRLLPQLLTPGNVRAGIEG